MFIRTLAALFAGVLIFSATAHGQTKLLRFPDIRGDRVVFTYAGDLWTAPSSGGSALRLTSHPGVEVFGKFSPDESGSLSQVSTTATSRSTLCPLPAASHDN